MHNSRYQGNKQKKLNMKIQQKKAINEKQKVLPPETWCCLNSTCIVTCNTNL